MEGASRLRHLRRRHLCSTATVIAILAMTPATSSRSFGSTPPGSALPPPPSLRSVPRGGDAPPVVVLDVDGTLYPSACGLESEIASNIHRHCAERYGISKAEADRLHRRHGSTVAGLAAERGISQEETESFYREVYSGLDVRKIMGSSPKNGAAGGTTGYDHDDGGWHGEELRTLLTRGSSPLAVASNSPFNHVRRVFSALGMEEVLDEAAEMVLTPDAVGTRDGSSGSMVVRRRRPRSYPTKAYDTGEEYWLPLTEKYGGGDRRIVLIEDSVANLRAAERAFGWEGILVASSAPEEYQGETASSPREAVRKALGIVPPSSRHVFDSVRYLKAKNAVDTVSIDRTVWNRFRAEVGRRRKVAGDGHLKIADLGCGRMSMLDKIVEGFKDEEGDAGMLVDPAVTRLTYIGYETNPVMIDECTAKLESMGFAPVAPSKDDNEKNTEHPHNGERVYEGFFTVQSAQSPSTLFQKRIPAQIRLRPYDFSSSSVSPTAVDAVVGCCLADLFDPNALVSAVRRAFLPVDEDHGGLLLYFPITFAGQTGTSPPSPIERLSDAPDGEHFPCRPIPSDANFFRAYARALEFMGHSLDPSLLVTSVVCRHGGRVLARGLSDWKIPYEGEKGNSYLWETMTYFFATSPAATEMMQGGWDMPGWFRRLRQHRPDIMARNVDLFFTLPSLDGTAGDLNFVEQKHGEENCRTKSVHMQELLFTGPRKVEVATKECSNHIGDDQVEVEAIMSLISSGTELTVFTGAFDVDAALDVNIGEMASQSMSYPLAYGYCMVGRVVRIGKEVTTPLLGKRVFCFAPHATRAVVDASSVQLLPQNVDTRDAIFLPSVETALSLVHEAGVRAGEAVAVFGQGLIGLLVTAVLAMTLGGGEEGSGYGAEGHVPVTAFDMLDERLMVSGALGASQAVRPSVDTKLFDIAIEVSGSPRGLQSAIDRTVEGGRIVVGSWYGKKEVALKLGIDFHRSHKTLVASQVSQIPAALAGTWDKKRRFAFAWEIVQRMRPSRYLLTKVVGLTSKEAQEAYLSLERGEEIAVAFDYGLENRQ